MDAHIQHVFVRELERQAQFGLIAVADLNAALAACDNDRVWYSIQGLLIAAGNVSKLLWPGPEYESRGAALRQLLSVADDSVLAPRTFRNHFEHFDERLDAWVAGDEAHNFVDSNIGPTGMISGLDSKNFLRNLDTTEMAVTFRGDSYRLQPITTALQDVCQRASQLGNAR